MGYERLTQCASPFFQRTRKNIFTSSSCTNGNVIRRARKSPTISIKTLQGPRARRIDTMKMIGCSARGWGRPVEKLNNRISRDWCPSMGPCLSSFLLRASVFYLFGRRESRKYAHHQSCDKIMLVHCHADVQDVYPESELSPRKFLNLCALERRKGDIGVAKCRSMAGTVEPRTEQNRPTGEVVDSRRLKWDSHLYRF